MKLNLFLTILMTKDQIYYNQRKSILEILKNTITIEDNNSINNYLSEDLINTFIKNIIIEDEKIINDKYFLKLKLILIKIRLLSF